MAKWQHPAVFELVIKMQRLRIKIEKLKLQSKLNNAQRMLRHQMKKITPEE